jgi:hypothetical protein
VPALLIAVGSEFSILRTMRIEYRPRSSLSDTSARQHICADTDTGGKDLPALRRLISAEHQILRPLRREHGRLTADVVPSFRPEYRFAPKMRIIIFVAPIEIQLHVNLYNEDLPYLPTYLLR